jgi:hypothetical protein
VAHGIEIGSPTDFLNAPRLVLSGGENVRKEYEREAAQSCFLSAAVILSVATTCSQCAASESGCHDGVGALRDRAWHAAMSGPGSRIAESGAGAPASPIADLHR